jgi:hypothetical protein
MWRFLNRRGVIRLGDFSPRHANNSDDISDEDQKLLTNFAN